MISPLPVTPVEGRRRAQWPPGTTDSLGAREAKVLHQVNQVVAQLKIRRHPVDRSYAHHFDLRQGRGRRFGRLHRRRLLRMRMCCKRPCRSQPSKQTDELAAFHVEHGLPPVADQRTRAISLPHTDRTASPWADLNCSELM